MMIQSKAAGLEVHSHLASNYFTGMLPERGVLHIKQMFDSTKELNALLDDFNNVTHGHGIDVFSEKRHGSSHSIIGSGQMKILRERTNTLNKIVKRLSDYFDLEPAQIRVNRYLRDEAKPAHQDAAATFESKASKEQNVTVALSLGSGRPIRFKSLHSDVTVDLKNVEGGDVYVFPKFVNQAFTHQVCCADEYTDDPDEMRLSIIIWGKSRKLKELRIKTLDELRITHPNLFDTDSSIVFGSESITIHWNECYTFDYSLEPTLAKMLSEISAYSTLDKLHGVRKRIRDNISTRHLSELQRDLRICQLFLSAVTGDNNFIIIRSKLDPERYCYAYCVCKSPKKLCLSVTGPDNKKGNAGKPYAACSKCRKGKDEFVKCHVYLWPTESDIVGKVPFYPGLTCVKQCGKASRLFPVPITLESFPRGKVQINGSHVDQLRWCCPGCLWIGPIYECKCVHDGTEEGMRLIEWDGKVYYGCGGGDLTCWFQVKFCHFLSFYFCFSHDSIKPNLSKTSKWQLNKPKHEVQFKEK